MPDITDLSPPAIQGETVAGRAAHVREQLKSLTADLTKPTFVLAELLHEATDNSLYRDWGYKSTVEYGVQELGLKERKIQYLVRIITVCKAVGLYRTRYETADISKLREITRLDPQGSFFNPETKIPEPLDAHIVRLVANANNMTGAQIEEEVRRLQGKVGGNRPVIKMMSWTEDTYNKVILPAQELARKRLGSAARDKNTGDAVEYSDSIVEECIHADFLSDSNNYPELEEVKVETEEI